ARQATRGCPSMSYLPTEPEPDRFVRARRQVGRVILYAISHRSLLLFSSYCWPAALHDLKSAHCSQITKQVRDPKIIPFSCQRVVRETQDQEHISAAKDPRR